MEIDRGSTRSLSVKKSLLKRLWTCHKTEYRMNESANIVLFSHLISLQWVFQFYHSFHGKSVSLYVRALTLPFSEPPNAHFGEGLYSYVTKFFIILSTSCSFEYIFTTDTKIHKLSIRFILLKSSKIYEAEIMKTVECASLLINFLLPCRLLYTFLQHIHNAQRRKLVRGSTHQLFGGPNCCNCCIRWIIRR